MARNSTGSTVYHLGLFAALSALCGLLVAGVLLPFTALAGAAVKAGASSLQSLPAELEIGPQAERSRVLMANGETLTEFYAENRVYVPLAKIAPVMRNAQVAIEDSRFYSHGAIDVRGTLRAALRSASGTTQGGSTLTQQYVKQVQVEAAAAAGDEEGVKEAREQSLSRKVRELRYALAVEKKLSKDQILERYLNIAYYGDGAYGVEAAAHHYFNTSAAQLTLPQAALLAGLVQNPVATEPVHHTSAALHRRDVVLNRMADLGVATPAQVAAAKKTGFDASKVQHTRNGCVGSRFPTLCLYVRNVLVSDAFGSLGKTPQQREDTLMRGGLTIRTLINPDAQASAEAAVAARVAPTDPFIATSVMVQPRTGLVIAMAQNRPKLGTAPGQTWFNYSVERSLGGAEGYQAGSTFKTFTMAAALNNGITPSRTYNSPSGMEFKGMTFRSCKGPFRSGEYHPKNSTGEGTFTMTEAAMRSINTYFLQLERDAGLCDTVRMAQAAGIQRADGKDLIKDSPYYDNVVAFTLGIVEVTPLSMAEAYATFANRGVHCDPIIVQSITTKAGKALTVPSANCRQVIRPEVADAVTSILQKVIGPGGTANPANLDDGRDQAAKTGTIDGAEAVWLAGYTPDVAGIAMIAADKQAPRYKGRSYRSITGQVAHGTDCPYGCELDGSGGRDAGRIWRTAMASALKGVPHTRFHAPSSDVILGKYQDLPNIRGMDLSDAEAAISAAGFGYQVARIHDDSAPGTYLYASPSSGRYRTSQLVTFYVSSGPAPKPAPSTRTPGRRTTTPASTRPSRTPSSKTSATGSTKPFQPQPSTKKKR